MSDENSTNESRAKIEDVTIDYNYFKNTAFIKEIINALPYIALILNKNRQVVFANDTLLDMLGLNDLKVILGFRPGEVIRCIHSNKTSSGCGTSKDCNYCGAVHAVLESVDSDKKVIKEARITSNFDGKEVYFDLQVTSSKFYRDDELFFLVSINDISDVKRRNILEKVFFHDIINVASGLKGYLDFILFDNDVSIETLKELKGISDTLLDDLLSQRDLLFAENNELIINKNSFYVKHLLEVVVDTIKYNGQLKKRKIQIQIDSDVEIFSDEKLLKRVLLNMLKNGLESSKDNEVILISSKEEGDKVILSVKNNVLLSDEVKSQIFQRSFSTKGRGRGLGTYSMKLFGEKYLKGHVSFTSDKENGTIFKIVLPKNIDD